MQVYECVSTYEYFTYINIEDKRKHFSKWQLGWVKKKDNNVRMKCRIIMFLALTCAWRLKKVKIDVSKVHAHTHRY